jgi:integrase
LKLDRFLLDHVSSRTRDDYSRKLKELKSFLEDKGKDMDKGEYGDTDVKEFLENEKDLSPSSMNNYLAIIKSFAGWQQNRINSTYSLQNYDNPTKVLMIRDEIREKLQTVRDISQYVENADDGDNALRKNQVSDLIDIASPIDRPVIVLYFYFGCRRMELPTFTNHLKELDIKNNVLKIDTLKYKKKVRERYLYFNDWVAQIFKRWDNGNLKLVYSSDGYYKKLKKYKDELGVDQLNPTTGRRTFDTHMRDILDDDPLVKSLMGHKLESSGMTDRYDVSFEEMRREAMIDKHYFNDLNLPSSPILG